MCCGFDVCLFKNRVTDFFSWAKKDIPPVRTKSEVFRVPKRTGVRMRNEKIKNSSLNVWKALFAGISVEACYQKQLIFVLEYQKCWSSTCTTSQFSTVAQLAQLGKFNRNLRNLGILSSTCATWRIPKLRKSQLREPNSGLSQPCSIMHVHLCLLACICKHSYAFAYICKHSHAFACICMHSNAFMFI